MWMLRRLFSLAPVSNFAEDGDPLLDPDNALASFPDPFERTARHLAQRAQGTAAAKAFIQQQLIELQANAPRLFAGTVGQADSFAAFEKRSGALSAQMRRARGKVLQMAVSLYGEEHATRAWGELFGKVPLVASNGEPVGSF
jgi:hypothetical protein